MVAEARPPIRGGTGLTLASPPVVDCPIFVVLTGNLEEAAGLRDRLQARPHGPIPGGHHWLRVVLGRAVEVAAIAAVPCRLRGHGDDHRHVVHARDGHLHASLEVEHVNPTSRRPQEACWPGAHIEGPLRPHLQDILVVKPNLPLLLPDAFHDMGHVELIHRLPHNALAVKLRADGGVADLPQDEAVASHERATDSNAHELAFAVLGQPLNPNPIGLH
mmetsp:Transcript_67411/g.186828  ORF Transcript_67411/g.186828 Transcript_67411/m.186828 type:complete len:218 (+) Transcript_67411:362-1015(+)